MKCPPRLQPARSHLALASLAILILLASGAQAQVGGGGAGGGAGGAGGGGTGGGGTGGGAGGTGSQAGGAGVVIDAQGVLRVLAAPGGGLTRERRKAAIAALEQDLRKPSSLRKVSLTRLEALVARGTTDGRGLPDAVGKLAGLTRVQYVFVYPRSGQAEGPGVGEIVLAGPAEPWVTDASGRVVGTETGSPTVLLEDVVAAVRAFPPGQPVDRAVGCSIDPKQEGLAAMQAYLKSIGTVNPRASTADIVTGMRQALGLQTVTVDGVSPATHFAQVLVEADYRMKLIGIGLEPPPVRMSTWIQLTTAGSVASNALQRWYFTPDYQCVRIAEDDLAIELVGRGVKLVGADEIVLPDGRRLSSQRASQASKLFTQAFTAKYPEIALRHPVYAQLRNMIDLAVLAAYLQEHDAYGKVGWGADVFLDEAACGIERYTPATEVETAVNAVWKGTRLLTPIGGGVTVLPRLALDATNLLMDEKGTVSKAHQAAAELPEGRWWWD
jgi:hypothetical protein